jgi:hypothetical protein
MRNPNLKGSLPIRYSAEDLKTSLSGLNIGRQKGIDKILDVTINYFLQVLLVSSRKRKPSQTFHTLIDNVFTFSVLNQTEKSIRELSAALKLTEDNVFSEVSHHIQAVVGHLRV